MGRKKRKDKKRKRGLGDGNERGRQGIVKYRRATVEDGSGYIGKRGITRKGAHIDIFVKHL